MWEQVKGLSVCLSICLSVCLSGVALRSSSLFLPARCQPKDRVVVAGLVAIQRANSEIIKPAKSDSKCAASVMIARLLAK